MGKIVGKGHPLSALMVFFFLFNGEEMTPTTLNYLNKIDIELIDIFFCKYL